VSTQRDSTDVYLGLIFGAIMLFLFLAAGGLLSAFLSGHGFPTPHAGGAITALVHASDPSFAWKVPVGPAWLYWTMTVASWAPYSRSSS
jgi:hypothetical protein